MVLNLSAYRFQAMPADLFALKADLWQKMRAFEVKGTVILSREGININIAGVRPNVLALKIYLVELLGLQDLSFKISSSKTMPFRRIKVKVKQEIITFRHDKIQPEQYTVQRLLPKNLKTWLDEGRSIVLLDVRNDYEVSIGHFVNARFCKMENFTQFSDHASGILSNIDRDTPIVTYCTGGVRCEKAGPVIEQLGFKAVYQLEGGILNYFEQCGEVHWQGNCFVFDARCAVTSSFEPVVE